MSTKTVRRMGDLEMTDFNLRKMSALLVFAALLAGCATVSFEHPKSTSTAITDTGDTALGRYAARETAEHPGRSAFYPLNQGMDALGIRLRLAERAEKSIDMQYFLMKLDTAGTVMANALLKAADRGVRVRFLLDDVFTTVPDRSFLLMNQHPNIEIRIFNPVSRRGIYAFNFIGQFSQANRRMHNKSFTVDNSISVVGGRNIADEYFELKTDAVFVDFDVWPWGQSPPTYPIPSTNTGTIHGRCPSSSSSRTPKKKIWRPFAQISQKNSMVSMTRYTSRHSTANCSWI
jgi:putative cardiolipin synthase